MWRDHSRVQLQRERERDEEKQHTAELCSEVAPRLPGVFGVCLHCHWVHQESTRARVSAAPGDRDS